MRNLHYVRSFPTPDSRKSRPMGEVIFTFKIQYKLFSKNNNKIPKSTSLQTKMWSGPSQQYPGPGGPKMFKMPKLWDIS